MSGPRIHYLKREEIDAERWDRCIDRSPAGLIYARTAYLDHVADNWHALVADDYNAVMPLTWKKKYGLSYLYQPFFTAALGVFSTKESNYTAADLIAQIPSRFRYWDIDLNESNVLPAQSWTHNRRNYHIDLSADIITIRGNYSRLVSRKLKGSKEAGLAIEKHADVGEVLAHYKKWYTPVHPNISGEVYKKLEAACNSLGAPHVQAYLARFPNQEIAGFYLVFADERFVYSVLGGSTPKGKEHGAFYALTDHVLNVNAGKEKTFRFEGSDLTGIAFFNEQFGPRPVTYQHLKKNMLPYPFRLFKR